MAETLKLQSEVRRTNKTLQEIEESALCFPVSTTMWTTAATLACTVWVCSIPTSDRNKHLGMSGSSRSGYFHCWAALPSQTASKGPGCWYSPLCSYLQKGQSTLEIQPWLQEIPTLLTANRHQQIIINLSTLTHISPASDREVCFVIPFNLSYSNSAQMKGQVLHSLLPLHNKQH